MYRVVACFVLAACGSDSISVVEPGDNSDDGTPTNDDQSAQDNTEDTSEESKDSTQETETTDTDVVYVDTGTWSVVNVNAIDDPCGVGDFQDVTEMVPTSFDVVESDTTKFFLDDGTVCYADTGETHVCDTVYIQESALAGTATMDIESIMIADVLSGTQMDLTFDVLLASCEGAGCVMIELALEFPCPVTLTAEASN